MLVELAEAVSPGIVGDACAHVRAARLPPRAVAAEGDWFSIARAVPSVFRGWKRFGGSPNGTSIPRDVGDRR